MLGVSRNLGRFALKMSSKRSSLEIRVCTRTLFLDAKEYGKKYNLDEAKIVLQDSYWTYLPEKEKVRTLITCEHASNRFPQHLSKEHELLSTHWAVDIGAEDVAAAVSSSANLPLLSSRISRLVVDVNRPVSSDTMFRTMADGKPVKINANLSVEEKQDRIDRYWRPYRSELSRVLHTETHIDLVLSIHSFTPLYEGQARECEIGVLYLDHTPEVAQFLKHFNEAGYKVVENEPWPATLCDIATPVYAAGKKLVILEIRNDLASDPAFTARVANDIHHVLQSLHLA